jgi:hypothetical protein
MTKHIRVRAAGGTGGDDDAADLASFTPAFLWLLRDFYLRLEEDGRQVTPRDYLETALQPLSGAGRAVEAKNQVPVLVRSVALQPHVMGGLQRYDCPVRCWLEPLMVLLMPGADPREHQIAVPRPRLLHAGAPCERRGAAGCLGLAAALADEARVQVGLEARGSGRRNASRGFGLKQAETLRAPSLFVLQGRPAPPDAADLQ